MSHLHQSSVLITDIELFESVIAALYPQLKFNANTTKFKWYSYNVGDCDHMISYEVTPDAERKGARGHQMGLVRVPPEEDNGVPSWRLAFDPYDSYLANLIGKNGQKLLNDYTEAYCRRLAEAQGFMFTKQIDDNGDILIELVDSKV